MNIQLRIRTTQDRNSFCVFSASRNSWSFLKWNINSKSEKRHLFATVLLSNIRICTGIHFRKPNASLWDLWICYRSTMKVKELLWIWSDWTTRYGNVSCTSTMLLMSEKANENQPHTSNKNVTSCVLPTHGQKTPGPKQINQKREGKKFPSPSTSALKVNPGPSSVPCLDVQTPM